MISVIIPTYNRKQMLSQAIKSVLAQNYKEVEIIVIDDCSNDGTCELMTTFEKTYKNIKYIQNKKNMGAGYSRKTGFALSKGDYIVFFDDDDYYTNFMFFEKAISIFLSEEGNGLSFISGNSVIEYAKTRTREPNSINLVGRLDGFTYLLGFQIKLAKPLSTYCTVFSREALLKSDFNNMEMVNDSSIYLRALTSGDAFILEEVIGVYRIHESNISGHLSSRFIIENLNEKYIIKKFIQPRVMKLELYNWWIEQIKPTVYYYVIGSRPSFKDIVDIQYWILKHTKISIRLISMFLKMFRMRFSVMIKK